MELGSNYCLKGIQMSQYLRNLISWLVCDGLRPGVRNILPGEQIDREQYWILVQSSRPQEPKEFLGALEGNGLEVQSELLKRQ